MTADGSSGLHGSLACLPPPPLRTRLASWGGRADFWLRVSDGSFCTAPASHISPVQKLDLPVPATGHTQDHRSGHPKPISRLGLGFPNVPSLSDCSLCIQGFSRALPAARLYERWEYRGLLSISLAGPCAAGSSDGVFGREVPALAVLSPSAVKPCRVLPPARPCGCFFGV